jgi:hypothetical protein
MAMQTMRRGALMERVMAALRCVPEVGLEIDQVAQAVGRDYDTTKATLARMKRLGMVWTVTLHHFAAYFSTAAARDAARAGIEEWHEAIRVQRGIETAKRQRVRERVRYGLAPEAKARPDEQSCTEFLSEYLKRMLPNPVSINQGVEACGKTRCSVKRSMARLVKQGRAWSISGHGFARYFGSQEARDAEAAAQHFSVKRAAPAKPRRGRRTTSTPPPYMPVPGGPKRQPKPQRLPVQIIGMETAPRIECPPCKLDRFGVTLKDPLPGGFVEQWLELRGLKPAAGRP